jgi:hypothetical protein
MLQVTGHRTNKMSEIVTIRKLWNGQPSVHSYYITLSISSSTGDIVIQVDAPFFDDKKPDAAPGKIEDLHLFEVVELFFSGIPYDLENDIDSPYLEIEIGPHGHYFLAFFMKEADFGNADTSIALEIPPKVSIDRNSGRWKAEMMVPFYLLPEPTCGEDLSVSWNFNAYAQHGASENREYLAFAPVPGEIPNFHQLHCFQHIELYETMEVRSNIDRTQSIANEKLGRIAGSQKNEKSHLSELMKLELLKEEDEEDAEDAANEPPDNFLSEKLSPSSHQSNQQNVRTVEEIGKQLKLTLDPKKIELEEKFLRHIQSDEFVILHEYLWKRKGISYKKRKLILTSKPRLIYFDPNGVYKGFIQWSMTKRLQLVRVNALFFFFFL